jgi:hypothetical protein
VVVPGRKGKVRAWGCGYDGGDKPGRSLEAEIAAFSQYL